jgi:hypothetical protein
MKHNKLTPGHNLLWESSRMMLPEHREQFLEYRRSLGQASQPILDEQQRAVLDQALMTAHQHHLTVCLQFFDPIQTETVRGRIYLLDAYKKRLKLEGETDWRAIDTLIEVELEA